MRFFTPILCLLLMTAGSLVAQNECATDDLHVKLLSESETYRQAWLERTEYQRLEDDTMEFIIPVVVHVIHLGEPVGWGSNISNGQIFQAVAKLNNDFRFAYGLDMGIRFCLAKRDPDGRPTGGIVRVDGRSVPNYQGQGLESSQGSGADETAVKDLSRWPNTRYYNIWVVHKIAGGVAGFAYYPTTYINDGTTIEALVMNNLLSTLTHELGHAFDLRHTFQGDGDGSTCPANTNCNTQGDQICDTPPHRRDDCYVTNPCSESGSDFPNVANNFMSYCLLQDRFTPEQRLRMRAAASSYPRNLLAQSDGCEELPALDAELSITNPLPKSSIERCGNSLEPAFLLTNRGAQTISSFEVAYTLNGTTGAADFTTTLLPASSADFIFPGLQTSGDGLYELTLDVTSVNGSADEVPANDSTTVSFSVADTCLVTGISEHVAQVRLYPNPVSGNVVQIEGWPSEGAIELHDLCGALYKRWEISRGSNALPLGGLPPGVYILNWEAYGKRQSMKLVRM